MVPIAPLLGLAFATAVAVPASAASFSKGFGKGFAISPVSAPFSGGGPPGGAAGQAFGPPGGAAFGPPGGSAFGPPGGSMFGPPGGSMFGPPGGSGFPGSPGDGGAVPGMTMPSEPSCPPTNGMVPLYVPDPDDCAKYTVCSGGFGMKLDCPPGLHFNSDTNHCDYPPLAGCEEIAPEDPTTLTGPPGIKKDAYFDMSLLSGPGFPMIFGQPNPGIGQLKNPPGKPKAPEA